MEETVWLAFGIIAVVVGIAIVISLLVTDKEEAKIDTFKKSFDRMENFCKGICDSPPESYDSIGIRLPSGLNVYTRDTKICGNFNTSNDAMSVVNYCVVCNPCTVSSSGLNLDTEIAKETFSFFEYTCFFNRTENDVKMECKG